MDRGDNFSLVFYSSVNNILLGIANLFFEMPDNDIDYYVTQGFQSMIHHNVVPEEAMAIIMSTTIFSEDVSRMHITVITRPKSSFNMSRENIHKALVMICDSDIVMKQYPMLVDLNRDNAIMHYGEKTVDFKQGYKIMKTVFDVFPDCTCHHMQTLKENPTKDSQQVLPYIKFYDNVIEADDIIPIETNNNTQNEPLGCSTCKKNFRTMDFGVSIVHCITADNKLILYGFCRQECLRFPKCILRCEVCSNQINDRMKNLRTCLYDVYFHYYGFHVLKFVCSSECKGKLRSEEGKDRKLALKSMCNACGTLKEKMQRCPCGNVHFCNVECQRKSWPEHKITCEWYLSKQKK